MIHYFRTFFSLQALRYTVLIVSIALIITWVGNPLLIHIPIFEEYLAALTLSTIGLVIGIYIFHFLGRFGFALAFFSSILLWSFSFITKNYRLEPSPAFISSILETGVTEAQGFLSLSTIFLPLAAITFYLVFIYWSKRFFVRSNAYIILLLAVHIFFVQSSSFTKKYTSKNMRHAARWSMEYITDPVKYTYDYFTDDEYSTEKLRSFPDPALYNTVRKDDKPLVLVFIVGESLRADHLGIYGYPRQTTPNLDQECLIIFRHARSFAAWTRESVIAMFVDQPITPAPVRHGSFVSIFKKLGFAINAYNSNTKPNRSDLSFSVLTKGAQTFYAPRPDFSLVKLFQENISTLQGSSLHIFSTFGSHFSYRDAYPREEAFFTPDTYQRPPRLEELPQIINAYDNSVLQTDKMIGAIINTLREKNAVLFYASDHGESLGEDGRFAHGDNTAPEQRHIPFFFWFSDTFKEAHPQILTALEQHTQQPVFHQNIFHTFLGIAGISSPIHDPSLDLTVAP